MNKQEVFNVVLAHAKQMTEKCSDEYPYQCVYIRSDGARCFVGALLSDATARACNPLGTWENVAKNLYAVRMYVGADIPDWMLEKSMVRFLSGIQEIHDFYPAKEYVEALRRVAEEQGLECA